MKETKWTQNNLEDFINKSLLKKLSDKMNDLDDDTKNYLSTRSFLYTCGRVSSIEILSTIITILTNGDVKQLNGLFDDIKL